MMYRPHPITCILPPHILRSIEENGSNVQKERASETLQVTGQLRQMRAVAPTEAPEAAAPKAVGGVKQRIVYSANYTSTLPGSIVRMEGGAPTGDPASDEAYDGAGSTYDLYWQIYNRNSIDNQGMRLDSTVHYQRNYDNAFWNGTQMVYGDGDEDLPANEQLFNRFTISVDVIGHELTHGVTQYTANLVYANQSGALNESVSDVFGSLVRQRGLAQTADAADWIIGKGLLTANVNGVGLRSMKAPGTAYDDPVLGKDPQPAHMKDYVTTVQDNGGVHINSGIPNHAFYLIAVEIGGNAWEKAGLIWYTALRDNFKATTNFQTAANLTYSVAGSLYGTESLEQKAVKNGWAQVGINVDTGEPPPNGNPGCVPSLLKSLGLRR